MEKATCCQILSTLLSIQLCITFGWLGIIYALFVEFGLGIRFVDALILFMTVCPIHTRNVSAFVLSIFSLCPPYYDVLINDVMEVVESVFIFHSYISTLAFLRLLFLVKYYLVEYFLVLVFWVFSCLAGIIAIRLVLKALFRRLAPVLMSPIVDPGEQTRERGDRLPPQTTREPAAPTIEPSSGRTSSSEAQSQTSTFDTYWPYERPYREGDFREGFYHNRRRQHGDTPGYI